MTTEERPEPPAYNVLKTWASDDWGLYGRGEELLSRALARNPRVGRVFHVQPPVDPAEMRQRFRDPRWEQDMEGQLRRFQGVEDGGVLLFTPAARRDQPEAALDRTVEFLERRQAFGRPLVMLQSLVHPFGNDLARRLGGRGVTRVALVRRDARAGYPPDADERKAIQDIYKNEIPGVELVWAGTRELVDEFKALNPRTVLQPIGADQGLAKGKPALELADLPRPVIIYAGSMRAYLNIGLIKGTAERLTDASFVFVGPAAEFLAPLVSGSRNVHVIGPRPYELHHRGGRGRGAPPAGVDRPRPVRVLACDPGSAQARPRPPPVAAAGGGGAAVLGRDRRSPGAERGRGARRRRPPRPT